ncbi:MAG: hypothetical protein KHZ87_08785 [Clostridiales bacterium]|nr:hypothetical protein [Clostridiales bacterium]
MIVKSDQIKILKHYIPDIEDKIAMDDVQVLLDEIDDLIVNDILGNMDEPTEEGIKLQRIYDEIFNQN